MFKVIKHHKKPLYEDVALQIEALIAEGNLKAGDQLPPERELAEIFGVSRTCIREAVKSLAARNLIIVEHGKGVFVLQTNSNDIEVSQLMAKLFAVNDDNMKDLYEIRKLIEPKAAAWAASRCTDEEAEEILSHFAKEQEYAHAINVIKMWEYDTKFHMAIVEATHNKVLTRIMRGMLDLLAESRRSTFRVKGRPLKSMKEHMLIAEAIRTKDPQAAERLMLEHLHNVEEEIQAFRDM